jgi:hypothetical protein
MRSLPLIVERCHQTRLCVSSLAGFPGATLEREPRMNSDDYLSPRPTIILPH